MARLSTALAVVTFSCLLMSANGNWGGNHGGHGNRIRPGDARSIQAALDAAAPGSKVTIPRGVYIVREPLIVRKSNITIYATGKNGSSLACHGLAEAPRFG
jgi:hypothetical protein